MSGIRKFKENSPIRVFVSHSAADAVLARQVRTLLSRRGNSRVFITDEVSAGEKWEARLRNELAEADIVIALLTPASVDSNWLLMEMGAAWGLRKLILPLVTTPAVLKRLPIALHGTTAVQLDMNTPEGNEQFLEAFESTLATSQIS